MQTLHDLFSTLVEHVGDVASAGGTGTGAESGCRWVVVGTEGEGDNDRLDDCSSGLSPQQGQTPTKAHSQWGAVTGVGRDDNGADDKSSCSISASGSAAMHCDHANTTTTTSSSSSGGGGSSKSTGDNAARTRVEPVVKAMVALHRLGQMAGALVTGADNCKKMRRRWKGLRHGIATLGTGDEMEGGGEAFVAQLMKRQASKALDGEMQFTEGALVECRYDGGDELYTGQVTRVHVKTRTYDILYDDGERQEHVQEDLIRLLVDRGDANDAVDKHSIDDNSKRERAPHMPPVPAPREQVDAPVQLHSYRGVEATKAKDGRFTAFVLIFDRRIPLGIFDSEHDAASAQDCALIRALGAQVCDDRQLLNFPITNYADVSMRAFTVFDAMLRKGLDGISEWREVKAPDFDFLLTKSYLAKQQQQLQWQQTVQSMILKSTEKKNNPKPKPKSNLGARFGDMQGSGRLPPYYGRQGVYEQCERLADGTTKVNRRVLVNNRMPPTNAHVKIAYEETPTVFKNTQSAFFTGFFYEPPVKWQIDPLPVHTSETFWSLRPGIRLHIRCTQKHPMPLKKPLYRHFRNYHEDCIMPGTMYYRPVDILSVTSKEKEWMRESSFDLGYLETILAARNATSSSIIATEKEKDEGTGGAFVDAAHGDNSASGQDKGSADENIDSSSCVTSTCNDEASGVQLGTMGDTEGRGVFDKFVEPCATYTSSLERHDLITGIVVLGSSTVTETGSAREALAKPSPDASPSPQTESLVSACSLPQAQSWSQVRVQREEKWGKMSMNNPSEPALALDYKEYLYLQPRSLFQCALKFKHCTDRAKSNGVAPQGGCVRIDGMLMAGETNPAVIVERPSLTSLTSAGLGIQKKFPAYIDNDSFPTSGNVQIRVTSRDELMDLKQFHVPIYGHLFEKSQWSLEVLFLMGQFLPCIDSLFHGSISSEQFALPMGTAARLTTQSNQRLTLAAVEEERANNPVHVELEVGWLLWTKGVAPDGKWAAKNLGNLLAQLVAVRRVVEAELETVQARSGRLTVQPEGVDTTITTSGQTAFVALLDTDTTMGFFKTPLQAHFIRNVLQGRPAFHQRDGESELLTRYLSEVAAHCQTFLQLLRH